MTRKYTKKLLEAMDDGIMDPKGLAESLLSWMSEDDVKEFYDRYDIAHDYGLEDDE